MSQYTINPDGSKKVFSRYTIKGVCTLNNIFPVSTKTTKKYLKKKKAFKDAQLQEKYGLHDNSALVRRIFSTFILKMLARVANGDIFIMPGSTQANITLKPIPDKTIKKLRQRGIYSNVDIVRMQFKVPQFIYDFGPFSRRDDIGIHVPPVLKQHAFKQAENGQIPWMYIPKTFNRDVQNV
jgi:hypothetical protein